MARLATPKPVRTEVLSVVINENEETIINLPQGGFIETLMIINVGTLNYEYALVMDGKKLETVNRPSTTSAHYEQDTTLAAHLPYGGGMKNYGSEMLRLVRKSLGAKPQLYFRATKSCRLLITVHYIGH